MAISKKPKKHDTRALIVEDERGKSEHRKLAEIKLSSNVLNTLTTDVDTGLKLTTHYG